MIAPHIRAIDNKLYEITSMGYRLIKERENLDLYRRFRGEPEQMKWRHSPCELGPASGLSLIEMFGGD
jgi:hypothetical protein